MRENIGSTPNNQQLGTESCRFDEPNLIAAGCEFTPLITLNDHTAAGLDAYHSGTDPAEGG